MTTTLPKVDTIERRWLLVDAQGQVLGRLASRLATVLRGKHKPIFTPFLDTGDFVVVINAEKIKVTGRKLKQKTYMRYSGYPSGHKTETLEDMLRRHPDRVLKLAVKRMLPQGPLGRRLLGKLKVYAGAAHPHSAQQPQPIEPRLVGAEAAHG
jgi:large subunit ribosomal protein L13